MQEKHTVISLPNGLFACAVCGRENFSGRGIKAHVCKPDKPGKPIAAPAAQESPATLESLTVDQLRDSYSQLDRYEEGCSRISGICATLKGLVLAEVKSKLGHGNFEPWLATHFPKGRTTAKKYLRLAKAFMTTKKAPRCLFAPDADLLGSLTLLQTAQLDVANPLVRDVSEWTDGKSAYQLLQDIAQAKEEPEQRQPRVKPTPEEILESVTCATREWATMELKERHWRKSTWRLLSDDEVTGILGFYREQMRAMEKWLKTPAPKRATLTLDELVAEDSEEEGSNTEGEA